MEILEKVWIRFLISAVLAEILTLGIRQNLSGAFALNTFILAAVFYIGLSKINNDRQRIKKKYQDRRSTDEILDKDI